MNKKFIISKNNEIIYIIRNGIKKSNNFYNIYNIESKNEYNRYCISVSKKFGNAVERNRIKRQIKNILMTNDIKKTNNYVIIIKSALKGLDYVDIKNNLIELIGCD